MTNSKGVILGHLPPRVQKVGEVLDHVKWRPHFRSAVAEAFLRRANVIRLVDGLKAAASLAFEYGDGVGVVWPYPVKRREGHAAATLPTKRCR